MAIKLLILTQKIDRNDPILGFFHRWVEEFAKQCESVIVICLQKVEYDLPKNVCVLSLGKELEIGNWKLEIVKKFIYVMNFYRYIWRERKNYDAVFVHMNPIYAVFGGILWRTWGKHIGLWYTHRSVDTKLCIAATLAHHIFTASRESFRLPKRKLHILGHGIDVEKFVCPGERKKITADPFMIIHVGRITPIKNIDILVEAAALLKAESNRRFRIVLVGEPATASDRTYKEMLLALIDKLGVSDLIVWEGSVSNSHIGEYYCGSDMSVNLAPTGGVDKAVLESMAAGTPVIAANRAFRDYFGKYADRLLYEERAPRDLAQKIQDLMKSTDLEAISTSLARQAQKKASVDVLVGNIIHLLVKEN